MKEPSKKVLTAAQAEANRIDDAVYQAIARLVDDHDMKKLEAIQLVNSLCEWGKIRKVFRKVFVQ